MTDETIDDLVNKRVEQVLKTRDTKKLDAEIAARKAAEQQTSVELSAEEKRALTPELYNRLRVEAPEKLGLKPLR